MRRAICVVLMVAMLLAMTACAQKQPEETTAKEPEETYPAISVYEDGEGTKRAYRMFPYYWMTDEAFEATCEGLLKYGDVVDEVTLFCDNMHTPYMPEDELTEYSTILKTRIEKLKELGFSSVGINMLQTIGQGDYGTGWLTTAPYQTAVGYNGATSVNQACPRAQGYLEYIAHKYEVYAATDPDFIWVDDDFRTPDKTVDYFCFCSNCVDTFNQTYGTQYTRETLVAALENNDEAGQDVRLKWSSYNLEAYENIMRIIADAVNGVDPEIDMGLMVVHLQANAYTLSDYRGMAEALGAEMIRPGGGVHDESTATSILAKIFGVSHQVAQLADVLDRQYELEDFPQTNYKSAKMHMLECTASLMAGCNAVAFASVPPDTGNDDVMDAVRDFAECWEEMVETGDGWKLYGATAFYDGDYGVYCEAGNYFSKSAHYIQNTEMTPFNYGFMSYTPYEENSVITVLSQDMVLCMDEDQLNEVFSKGVLLDGKAAELLVKRGYGDLIGCKRTTYMLTSVEERYLEHELNGSASGTIRYMYGAEYYSFTLKDGAQALGAAESVKGAQLGVSSYVYENELGGRVAVFGYMPWEYFDTWQRLEQTQNVCDWLAKDQLPVKVMNDDHIVSLIKQPDDRSEFMLMLINAYLDDTADTLTVRILGEYEGSLAYYNEDGERTSIPAENITVADGYTTVQLPALTGWGFGVLFTEQ